MVRNSVDECAESKVYEVLGDFTFKGALPFIKNDDLLEMYERLSDPDECPCYCHRLKDLMKNELVERHFCLE